MTNSGYTKQVLVHNASSGETFNLKPRYSQLHFLTIEAALQTLLFHLLRSAMKCYSNKYRLPGTITALLRPCLTQIIASGWSYDWFRPINVEQWRPLHQRLWCSSLTGFLSFWILFHTNSYFIIAISESN